LLLLLAGCASEPFAREPLPKLQSPDPAAMHQRFEQSIPPKFISDDTVIIHAPFHDDMAILGVLRVDRPANTFELVGLNQLGVKLFDLVGDAGGTTTIRFALPPLMKQQQVLVSIGNDIRRMFFNLLPAPDAKITFESTDVKFKQPSPEGKLVFKIGADPPVLLEKRVDGFFGAPWRVRYYRYASQDGRLYPRGLVMDNGKFHYRIVVKNRDVEFDR
jgi:hypothetical protein